MKNGYLLFYTIISFFLFQQCTSPETSSNENIEEVIEEIPVVEEGPIFDSLAYNWLDGYVDLNWATLAKVDFELRLDESVGTEIPFPIFSEEIEALNGQPIQIRGYVIPLEETGGESFLILSAFPYSQCFFCGNAGPESVIDVLVKEDVGHLRTDQQLTFRGILKVNGTDLNYLNYILQEAEIVE